MINQVKLSKYFQGYKYFNGRDNGRDTRKTLNLDKVDENKESITFFFEKGLVGMNVSFFLGLFGKTISNCGVEDFKKRYNFEYEDPDENKKLFEESEDRSNGYLYYHLSNKTEAKKLFDKDIEYGIDTVLSEITPENLIHRLQGKWVYGKLC